MLGGGLAVGVGAPAGHTAVVQRHDHRQVRLDLQGELTPGQANPTLLVRLLLLLAAPMTPTNLTISSL